MEEKESAVRAACLGSSFCSTKSAMSTHQTEQHSKGIAHSPKPGPCCIGFSSVYARLSEHKHENGKEIEPRHIQVH